MNEKIDVLAVIRKHAESHRALAGSDAYSEQEAPKLKETLAAVAELIEAAASALYDIREVRDRCTSLVAVGLDEQVGETIDRLAAALARIGTA